VLRGARGGLYIEERREAEPDPATAVRARQVR
jgi:hypothetical protein